MAYAENNYTTPIDFDKAVVAAFDQNVLPHVKFIDKAITEYANTHYLENPTEIVVKLPIEPTSLLSGELRNHLMIRYMRNGWKDVAHANLDEGEGERTIFTFTKVMRKDYPSMD